MEFDEPGLLRFWFEFDLTGHAPPPLEPGQLRCCGGDDVYRMLSLGAGVTGYDQRDCLAVLEREIGQRLPPVTRVVRQPDLSTPLGRHVAATWIGNPVWRGVWFPPLNLVGPVID